MVVVLEMLYYVLKGTNRSETTVLLTAVLTVFKIYLLALVCLVALYLPVVERHLASLDPSSYNARTLYFDMESIKHVVGTHNIFQTANIYNYIYYIT